jgi:hypothetical protein
VRANRKEARCSAALEAVRILHKLGALDDHLKPAERDTEDLKEILSLFPHWKNEEKSSGEPCAGSTQNRRNHDKHVSHFTFTQPI